MVNEDALLAHREKKKVNTALLMKAIEGLLIGKSNRETTEEREKIHNEAVMLGFGILEEKTA